MNRISRLIHKANFLKRQRLAINHSHKYVITYQDTQRTSKIETSPDIMEGFDPDNNEQDRRMLYEVTGMRLNRDEFLDEDS